MFRRIAKRAELTGVAGIVDDSVVLGAVVVLVEVVSVVAGVEVVVLVVVVATIFSVASVQDTEKVFEQDPLLSNIQIDVRSLDVQWIPQHR